MAETNHSEAYGATVAPLGKVLQHFEPMVEHFVEDFYKELARRSGPNAILSFLSQNDRSHLLSKQVAHLRLLLDPHLDKQAHFESGRRIGRIHALVGVESTWLVAAYKQYLCLLLDDSLVSMGLSRSDRELFKKVITLRIINELHEEMEGQREIERQQNHVLSRIDQLLYTASTFTDLAFDVLSVLADLEGIVAATIARPDASGNLQFEVIIGERFKSFVSPLGAGHGLSISIREDDPTGQGPSGRAWRSGSVEVVQSFAQNPSMAPWREFAMDMGIHSAAAIPLLDGDGRPQALMSLYSAWPGYFATTGRQDLLMHLRQMLAMAFTRFSNPGRVIPYMIRRTYHELLENGGLEMHYQPVIDFPSGELHKVEALARLRDSQGKLLSPGDFLPAFGNQELKRLFALGLSQSLSALHGWEAHGIHTAVSINLPAQGFLDPLYVEIVRKALETSLIDPHRLTLELLESGEVDDIGRRDMAMTELRAMGIRFAQDDLGSGYSSLLRLDSITFDEVKIEQGLVRGAADRPRKALNFIQHLTRLVHGFGVKVIVEGLESKGLIEAAAILGADSGQGYAIAKPMPANEIISWCKSPPITVDSERPQTALGAFATYILRDLQLSVLDLLPELTDRFLKSPCGLGHYIHSTGLDGTPLGATHQLMQAAAKMGVSSRQYQQTAKQLGLLLAERILFENSE